MDKYDSHESLKTEEKPIEISDIKIIEENASIKKEKSVCSEAVSENETEIDTRFITKLQPFDITYVDGFDKDIGVRYYENQLKQSCVVYTMSNIVILYKSESSSSNVTTTCNIVGHEMKIIDIQIDGNYKIMMSCDIESVFLWDLQNADKVDPVILRIIFQPFGDKTNILLAGLSYCGKYILIASQKVFISENEDETEEENTTVGAGNYVLQFWEWSYSRSECDDFIHLPLNYGLVTKITFNCNVNESHFFALTYPKNVVFGTVLHHNEQKIHVHNPKCSISSKLNATCYLKNSRMVLSCTNKGDLIVWYDKEVYDKETGDPLHINKSIYEKNFHRMISLTNVNLTDIKNFNNCIVTTDSSGDTRFYDYNLLLLYIWKIDEDNPQHLLSVCPGSELSNFESSTEFDFPKDLSLHHKNFLMQPFFIVNSNGEAYSCNITQSLRKKLSFSASYRNYTDAFIYKPWLVFCLESGVVQLVNYNTKRILAYYDIYKNIEPEFRSPITYCTVSKEENYIGVALRNGYVFLLDSFTCQPTHTSIIKVKNQVTNINFGSNELCVIVDHRHAILIMKYEDGEWNCVNKLRYHIDSIINVFFIQNNNERYLLSIGADRIYNKYIINDNISIVHQKRLEQKPKITAANIYYPQDLQIDCDNQILVTANDLYKIVLYNAYTADKLYTYLGPVFDSPIQRIKLISPSDSNPNSYFIVVTKKTLGSILLPIDGNPYRNSGVLAHHSNIYRVKISCEGSYIMLFGEKDSGGYFWTLNKDAINNNFKCGGDGLEPFCRLLPGGKTGWLFKEMQDYFYYFQLITNPIDSSKKTQITENITISNIADFMRALGFFPSDFEIKDMIDEVTRTKYAWQQRRKNIGFSDLVKLFINHKPVDGYSLIDIFNSIKVVGETSARFIVLDNADVNLNVDHLLAILTNKGESIPKIQAMKYIIELLKPKGVILSTRCDVMTDEGIVSYFNNLRDQTFSNLEVCETLLGINVIMNPIGYSISMATDDRADPTTIYPALENRLPRVIQADDSSDEE